MAVSLCSNQISSRDETGCFVSSYGSGWRSRAVVKYLGQSNHLISMKKGMVLQINFFSFGTKFGKVWSVQLLAVLFSVLDHLHRSSLEHWKNKLSEQNRLSKSQYDFSFKISPQSSLKIFFCSKGVKYLSKTNWSEPSELNFLSLIKWDSKEHWCCFVVFCVFLRHSHWRFSSKMRKLSNLKFAGVRLGKLKKKSACSWVLKHLDSRKPDALDASGRLAKREKKSYAANTLPRPNDLPIAQTRSRTDDRLVEGTCREKREDYLHRYPGCDLWCKLTGLMHGRKWTPVTDGQLMRWVSGQGARHWSTTLPNPNKLHAYFPSYKRRSGSHCNVDRKWNVNYKGDRAPAGDSLGGGTLTANLKLKRLTRACVNTAYVTRYPGQLGSGIHQSIHHLVCQSHKISTRPGAHYIPSTCMSSVWIAVPVNWE